MRPSSGFSFVLMNSEEEGEKETECCVLLADILGNTVVSAGDELGSGSVASLSRVTFRYAEINKGRL